MKYYTLKIISISGNNSYQYKAFDEDLKEVEAKHLNPKITKELGLIEIFAKGAISLECYEDNILIGEINGKEYFAKGNRIKNAAIGAAKKLGLNGF